jgi:hypothetical protein
MSKWIVRRHCGADGRFGRGRFFADRVVGRGRQGHNHGGGHFIGNGGQQGKVFGSLCRVLRSAAHLGKHVLDGLHQRFGIVGPAITVYLRGQRQIGGHIHANHVHRDAAGQHVGQVLLHKLLVGGLAIGDDQ